MTLKVPTSPLILVEGILIECQYPAVEAGRSPCADHPCCTTEQVVSIELPSLSWTAQAEYSGRKQYNHIQRAQDQNLERAALESRKSFWIDARDKAQVVETHERDQSGAGHAEADEDDRGHRIEATRLRLEEMQRNEQEGYAHRKVGDGLDGSREGNELPLQPGLSL